MAVKKSTGRSNQGRGNKNKGGKTAGKGFVAPRASRSDKKAIGKGLAKMAAAAAPGGAAVKGAMAINKARKAAKATSKARTLNPSKKTFGQINKEASSSAKRKYYNQRTRDRVYRNEMRDRAESSRGQYDDPRDMESAFEVAGSAALKRKPNISKTALKAQRTVARRKRREARTENYRATGERARTVTVNKYGEPQAVRGGRGAVTRKQTMRYKGSSLRKR